MIEPMSRRDDGPTWTELDKIIQDYDRLLMEQRLRFVRHMDLHRWSNLCFYCVGMAAGALLQWWLAR